MATVTNENLLARWWTELGRTDARWLTRSPSYRVDPETGMLTFVQRIEAGRAPQREQMGRMVGDRFKGGVMLLNGDGFGAWDFTELQTRLRERAQRDFGWHRVAIIPYQALRGAQIDLDSFKAIEITQDRQDNFWVQLDPGVFAERQPPALVEIGNSTSDDHGWEISANGATSKVMTGELNGARLNVTFMRSSRSEPWTVYVVNVWAAPEFDRHDWQRCTYSNNGLVSVRGPNNEPTNEYRMGWGWNEVVHRLGSVVFSAVSRTDGARHRYLSSFDMQEPGGLYFLAMLPAKGKCSSVEDAIDLLCPEIVRLNRENGKEVCRQGDVFAIETDLTDEQVYDGAVTRVSRHIVMQDSEVIRRGGLALLPPGDGEVWEYGTCPFCDSKRHRIGNGPKARAALSIHNTGHTANEVVVKDNGVTFIRGAMFHDPQIEDPTRNAPDHQPITLGSTIAAVATGANLLRTGEAATWPTLRTKGKWFLAVRNTVPRVRRRREAPPIELARDAVVAVPAVTDRNRDLAEALA